MTRKLLTAEQFKAGDYSKDEEILVVKCATAGVVPVTESICRALDLDSVERGILMTISDDGRDRDRDRIRTAGWDFSAFKSNPVVLWGHNSSAPPIGRARKLWKDTVEPKGVGPVVRRVRAVKQFTDEETNPFGFMVYRLMREGYLKAASVGFIPREAERDKAVEEWGEKEGDPIGFHFVKQELLESSIVSIPSNPRALAGAKSAGVDLSPYGEWTEKILDNENVSPIFLPEDGVARFAKRLEIEEVREVAGLAKTSTTVPDAVEPEDKAPDVALFEASEAFRDAVLDLSKAATEAGHRLELDVSVKLIDSLIDDGGDPSKKEPSQPAGEEGDDDNDSGSEGLDNGDVIIQLVG